MEYKGRILFQIKAILITSLAMLLLLFLFGIITKLIKINPSLILIISMLIFASPFFFKKKYLWNFFTKTAIIKLDDNCISIITYGLKTGKLERQIDYLWTDIKAYKFRFQKIDKLIILKLFFVKGGGKIFNFIEEKDEEGDIQNEDVYSVFTNFVTGYNINQPVENKIQLSSYSFFTSVWGTATLVLVGCIIVFDIILHIVKGVHNPAILIFAISTFIRVLLLRRDAKRGNSSTGSV